MDIEGIIRSKMNDIILKKIDGMAEAMTKYLQDEFIKEIPHWAQVKYSDELEGMRAVAHYDGGESGSITVNMPDLPDFLKKEMSEIYIDNAKRRAMG